MVQFFKNIFKSEKSFFFMAPALAWQIAFCILSLLFVVQLSFCTDLFSGVTGQYFAAIIKFSHFLVIFRSMLLASVTAILCLLVGYPVAYYLALYAPERLRTGFVFFVI